MVCMTVERFTDSLNEITKQDILKVDKLVGYGIGCTGDGIIGVYKLVMSYDKIVEFIT